MEKVHTDGNPADMLTKVNHIEVQGLHEQGWFVQYLKLQREEQKISTGFDFF